MNGSYEIMIIGGKGPVLNQYEEILAGIHQSTFSCVDGYTFTNDQTTQLFNCSHIGGAAAWLPADSKDVAQGCIGKLEILFCFLSPFTSYITPFMEVQFVQRQLPLNYLNRKGLIG